jgi:hypothetical protein
MIVGVEVIHKDMLGEHSCASLVKRLTWDRWPFVLEKCNA